MNEKLKEKIREALASVLPITGIVLLLSQRRNRHSRTAAHYRKRRAVFESAHSGGAGFRLDYRAPRHQKRCNELDRRLLRIKHEGARAGRFHAG